MDERVIWASGHGVVLLAILAGFAFTSGYWAILIALVPAAYLLVLFPHDSDNSPKIVVISHLAALLAGWIGYMSLAQGISLTSIEPMSEPGLRVVGGALLAFVGCTAVFYLLHIQHPMAYVTAFTAAIGAFPTTQALAVVVVVILLVAGFQALRRKLGPKPNAEPGMPVDSHSGASNHR